MFPDISGLKKSIDENTAVQQEMIEILKELTNQTARMTVELEQMTLQFRASNKRAGTSSAGPK